MDKTVMWILYGVLVAILGVVGYYVGKNYAAIGKTVGAGVGVAAGILVSGAIYYAQREEEAYV